MSNGTPGKVLITSGKPAGGIASFAEALAAGFEAIGVSARVIQPGQLAGCRRDLRDPSVLKILSTTGVFAAPFTKRCICVAHGFPRIDMQGLVRFAGVAASFQIASQCSRLVAVSEYAAIHLRTIFNLRVDAVIHNPVHAMFLDDREENPPREYVTFVGRLHPSKRLASIFPAVRALLDQTPGLRACFIGDGPLRGMLESAAGSDPRVEIPGPLPPLRVRAWLRRTRIFVSGCETEALGIAYIEALSQGCTVVMPACGGGLEIAPEQIGAWVHLVSLPIGPDAFLSALRRALNTAPAPPPLASYSARCVAAAYLRVDAGQTEETAGSACNSVVRI